MGYLNGDSCLVTPFYGFGSPHLCVPPRPAAPAGAKGPGGEEGEEECAICRSEVDLTQPALYMVTPCDHARGTHPPNDWGGGVGVRWIRSKDSFRLPFRDVPIQWDLDALLCSIRFIP